MDPKDIQKLASCLRDQGDKLLTSQFKFTLNGELLRSLNDSFSLIIDENEFVAPQMFQVTKPNNAKSNVFRELMFIYDFIQKTLVLKLTKFLEDDDEDETCVIDISKFRNLTTIELQRIDIQRVIGLQLLRSQLQEITAERCLKNIKDLLMHCAGDNSNSFIWNSLKRADFSYNNLERVDNSFEFTPYIQHLNLSHNKIFHISALVWLPNLKNLNLSFNQLTSIPKLNVESSKRLQVLTINANLIEDLSGIIRLDALLELDLSDNCLLDHQTLLPLCTLNSLRYLNLSGNPLSFHAKHRSATCRYLSKNAAQVQFQLDGEFLSKSEKSLSGSYENYFPLFGSRMTMSTSSSRATPSSKSRYGDTPNSSFGSTNSFPVSNTASNQKRMRPRCVEIEDSETKSKLKVETKSPFLRESSKDHLTTKIEIEKMREQFGNDWLHNHEGKEQNESEKGSKRKLFEDIIAISPSGSGDDATIINDSVGNETNYKTAEESAYDTAFDESVETMQQEEKVVLSDPEENEAEFIVIDAFSKEDLFLIVSDTSIREKDAMTARTITKWGIGTLESVERPRTCIIHLTFDTIRKDKRERQYEMEAKSCQQLERILRDYLSTKPLSEMNQTVYKCLKCNSEFSREVVDDRKRRDNEIKCPCGNRYVIEIEKTSKCAADNHPPRSSLSFPTEMLKGKKVEKNIADSASIAIETPRDEVPKTCHSISSIESAFDSNQSVAGSSVEVLSESSQISHVSSQSSIEVLDRKPSEEREREEENLGNVMKKSIEESLKQKVVAGIGNVNLTESSSSGSVCESVVTAYEQPTKTIEDQVFTKVSNFLFPNKPTKPIDHKSTPLNPIQYNYEDLVNVDHRVKLFLFQNVFEENDEKLMWLVKCDLIDDSQYSDGISTSSLTVMSTKKIYFLKISGEESDDIQNWLKKFISFSLDRIESIRELPSKIGMSFIFKSNTSKVHILLRDQLLFEKLKTGIVSSFCDGSQVINFNDSAKFNERIEKFIGENDVRIVGVFKSCSSSIQSATDSDNSEVTSKAKLKLGAIIVSSDSIHVTTNLKWICDHVDDRVFAKSSTLTQPLSNLVELEHLTTSSFTLNFIDELEDTLEKWKFTLESKHHIMNLLRVVDEIWEKIFCMHLLSDDQLAS